MCESVGDTFYACQLKPQLACCICLGGRGETFSAAEIEQLLQEGQELQVKALADLPESWHSALSEIKHREVVLESVIPEILKRDQTDALQGDSIPVLQAMYATPKAESLPAGALTSEPSETDNGKKGRGSAKGRKSKAAGVTKALDDLSIS